MTQVSFDSERIRPDTPTKYSMMALFTFFVQIFLLHTTLNSTVVSTLMAKSICILS